LVSECHEHNNNKAIEVTVTSTNNAKAIASDYDVSSAEAALIALADAAAQEALSGGYNTRGMSFAGTLMAYDWGSDLSEMSFAAWAYGLNVSNHSYSFIHGWYYNSGEGVWYWYGDADLDPNEEYGFGYYGQAARDRDAVAYDAPYYTICQSAGNDRDDMGPDPGQGHYYWNGGWTWSTTTRLPDCPTGYDCVGIKASAKNSVTVGAVWDIPNGYDNPADVVMSTFSGWGPTDDGRIKPDIVANGMNLLSSYNGHDADYGSISGTSMSTPNVSGSLNLLVRFFETLNSSMTPRSSTIKALMIHGADEAGPDPGPDYMNGWGMMNTLNSAQIIEADAAGPERIIEDQLEDGSSDRYLILCDGAGPLRVTMVWTDPPGPVAPYAIDPPDLALVNDLDMRLEHAGTATVYYPYILDPANPSAAATIGDNFRDNVEQIHVEAPEAGTYILTINYKNVLTNGFQAYSLVSTHQMPFPCCGFYDPDNRSGNVDYDPGNFKEISDILMLARYALQGGQRPLCLDEANTDSDADCFTDISDILRLARYSLQGGEAPAICLPACE
jgi:hypothetical protein